MASYPSTTQLRALGEKWSKQLDANYTYEEIATELGITAKRAHYECALALGKLVHGLKKNLQATGVNRVQH